MFSSHFYQNISNFQGYTRFHFLTVFDFFKTLLVAPAPLSIRGCRKTTKIANVLKTNEKVMIFITFWVHCVVAFLFFLYGFRSLTSSSRAVSEWRGVQRLGYIFYFCFFILKYFRCPEVRLEFSTLRCPEVRLEFSTLRCPEVRLEFSTLRCPEVRLEFQLLGVERSV